MKIRLKLILSFLVVTGFVAVSGVLGVRLADQISRFRHQELSMEQSLGELKLVSFVDALQNALVLTGAHLGTNNIEVKCQNLDKIPPLYADQNMLEEVLLNLLINAKDAILAGTDGGGEIIFSAESTDPPVIAVSDSGIDIPRDVENKIFDPFFSTKEVGCGTGLGMSVTYGIMQTMGGRIDFLRDENMKKTFLLTFKSTDLVS